MKRLASLALLLCLLLPTLTLALDTTTRAVSPVRAWSEADLATFDPAWLHVKFVEGSAVRPEAGRLVSARGAELSACERAPGRRPGAALAPSTWTPPRSAALKAAGEAASGVTGPDLSLWFDLRGGRRPRRLAAMLNALNAHPAVEIAHPAPICEPAAIVRRSRRPRRLDGIPAHAGLQRPAGLPLRPARRPGRRRGLGPAGRPRRRDALHRRRARLDAKPRGLRLRQLLLSRAARPSTPATMTTARPSSARSSASTTASG